MWLLCLPPPRVLLLCCFVAYRIELRTERQNVPCQAAPSPILGAISPLKARGAQGQTDRWEHKFRPSKEQGFCPGSSQGCPSRASGTTPMEMCNLWIPAWDKEQLSGSLPGITTWDQGDCVKAGETSLLGMHRIYNRMFGEGTKGG